VANRDSLSVDVYGSIGELASAWDALVDRTGSPPFLRPGWFAAHRAAFGSGTLELFAAHREDRLVGVAPLARARGVLASLTNWHTPEFAFVGEDEAALRTLAEAVCSRRTRRVSLWFANPVNPDYDACFQSAHARGRRVLTRTLERPPQVDVGGDWDAYEAGVSARVRRDLRRRRRLLEREGSVSLEVLDGTTRLDSLLEDGFRVEASGWKGEQGIAIASSPETRRFYTEIARWAALRGWLRLAFLRLDGHPVAFQYGLEDGRRYYFLKGGYDVAFSRFAPGRLLLASMIERAFVERLELFDFGGEDEPFKREWANAARELVLIQVFPRTLPGLVEWAAFAHGRPLAKRVLALAGR
jgi:CelD/BcsL family acetyltransferase involved in cellulose biosynthesis